MKMENFATPTNSFATPTNTLGISEPAPIETNVPAGFILGKNLPDYIKKKKNKKLIEFIKDK